MGSSLADLTNARKGRSDADLLLQSPGPFSCRSQMADVYATRTGTSRLVIQSESNSAASPRLLGDIPLRLCL